MPFPKPLDRSKYTFDDFPPGTRVMVISKWVDFSPFYRETGTVTKNSGKYLGIIVEFDSPRHFRDGHVQQDFNFNPENLVPLDHRNPEKEPPEEIKP